MTRDDATQAQVNAADPMNSTWLSANAGSGKTRVLTDRVARLLLEGVEPQNILCLTYTKAAASEMQNRLFKRLGAWAMLDDSSLRDDLRVLGVEGAIDPLRLRNARTLFARAIETPGGLKIQTIHSFCASILRRFPLEAQVSPQFREMEERQAALLRTEVLDQMSDGSHQTVVLGLLAHFTGADLDKFIAEITGHRGAFALPLDTMKLRKTLCLEPSITLDSLLGGIFDADAAEIIRDTIAMCRTGTTNDLKVADKLSSVNLTTPRSDDLALLESAFLYTSGSKNPFGPKIDALPTKALRAAHPDLIDSLNGLMERVADSRNDRLALQVFMRTQALYAFATEFVTAYEARKLAMGMLDFDDLIEKARDLLTNPAVAQWVLYRLDGGIDHVLVDEAQDTSPAQWAVIEHLTKEFASGEGARSNQRRTIFVVGDKKQSIYSFQGADPDEFDRMRAYFADALAQAQDRLETQQLAHSFRSSEAVLRVVDATFQGERAVGLGNDVFHMAFKENMPGRVDLWPAVEKSEKVPERDWFDPVDTVSESHHNVQLANLIAAQIKRMIRDESIPEEVGQTGEYISRKITEGDFLILVQRRSELFSEIIRACKQAELQIAGADRLRVGGELAVKDIAALLSFIALPEDDLSLASALRSPLFGWSEKQLYDLAQPRPKGQFLWKTLRDSDKHPETLAVLKDLRDAADFLRPYDLIERILTRHDGRRHLLARLGAEAEDGIDALLAQALAYEHTTVPGLTGFLTWLETDELQIKRQMDAQGDRIRVMTVHGAKGLEAPIVILPDCAKVTPKIRQELYRADGQLIWRPKADDAPAAVVGLQEDILAAQHRERMRLLYVAMTRAEKWLIVAAAGETGTGDESWYAIAADGIAAAGPAEAKAGDLSVQRVSALTWQAGAVQDKARAERPAVAAPVLHVLPPAARIKALSPSQLGGAKIIPGDPGGEDEEAAKARGTAMHLLLEHLPYLESENQVAVGHSLLAALPDFHGPDIARALIDDARAIMTRPELAFVFAPDVLTEVAVTASLPALGHRRVQGAIDRLIIGPDTILAVDYKTNRLIPDAPDKTPEGVLRQQGAYAAVLAEIYPGHRIDMAILWTQGPSLMYLPPPLISAALGRVTVA